MHTDSPSRPAYVDRSGWLAFFGVVQILLGLGAAFMGLFMLLMPLIMKGRPGYDPTPERFMLPAVAMYFVMGLHFVAVGVGSIRARRWAWALSLIVSWLWLIVGIVAVICMGYLLPAMFNSPGLGGARMPAGAKVAVLVFTLLACGFIYVLLPLVLVLFYRGPNVRRTIEARDPVERWTDRRPLPLTAMFLVLAFASWSCLMMLPVGYAVPLFGRLVAGPTGLALLVAQAAVCAILAWGSLRRSLLAWWGTLGLILFWVASSGITFARVDFMEFYRAMGYPEQQIAQLRALGIFTNDNMLLGLALGAAIWGGALVWLKRYFGGERREAIR